MPVPAVMGKAWASAAVVALAMLNVPLIAHATPATLDSTIIAVPPSADMRTGSIGARGGYLTLAVVADVEGTLTFTNADLTAHDVISRAVGPGDNLWCARYVTLGTCPLFASPIIGMAEQAPVEGTDQLVPGTAYEFYCSIHPWMTGKLVAV